MRVVIAGGGVIGVCCAYYLAKAGVEVTLLERADIGDGATFGNAGVIAPGHTPIAKPGRLKQALRSMLQPLSPFYVPPRLNLSLLRWLFAFARHCTQRHVTFAMQTLGPMGHASLRLFDELIAEEELACGYRRAGFYEVCLSEGGLRAVTEEAAFVKGYGFDSRALSGAELREREPRLGESIIGGVWYPEAATMNPHGFVTELAARARRLGAALCTGKEVAAVLVESGRVRGVRTRQGELVEADAVVLAAGAYTVPLVRQLGLKLPLEPAKGYHRDAVATSSEPLLRESCVLAERLVFCTPMHAFTRFAGTLEFSGVNHDIRRPRLEQLTRAARDYFPHLPPFEIVSEWCGLRPCLPDGLPAIGAVQRYPGLYVATGHAMAGLTLGPITGKLVAELLTTGTTSIDITALRPDRFSGAGQLA
ncbi:MAG: FAD-dependent oxidoreductase [Bryobacterales bacterium]|nr:FAD-dependent oxidoreductase [Bryobacteraceae bacterium]MDW8354641.1 FAD-dependent oxidoreductase [Bryobacterales bacterium]